jgi:hypothetical protein
MTTQINNQINAIIIQMDKQIGTEINTLLTNVDKKISVITKKLDMFEDIFNGPTNEPLILVDETNVNNEINSNFNKTITLNINETGNN